MGLLTRLFIWLLSTRPGLWLYYQYSRFFKKEQHMTMMEISQIMVHCEDCVDVKTIDRPVVYNDFCDEHVTEVKGSRFELKEEWEGRDA